MLHDISFYKIQYCLFSVITCSAFNKNSHDFFLMCDKTIFIAFIHSYVPTLFTLDSCRKKNVNGTAFFLIIMF